jgi:hypothetical protein
MAADRTETGSDSDAADLLDVSHAPNGFSHPK